MASQSGRCFVRLCGLLIVAIGSCGLAFGDCNCPRMLYMTVPAGSQTYHYYMSTRFDDSVSPCVAKTTTTMYSATALDVFSTCCGGDCVALPVGAPTSPLAAIPTSKKVDPLETGSLKKSYIATIGGFEPCKSGEDCWQMTALAKLESFYFKLQRVDGSEVWVQAMVHRVKFKVTLPSGTKTNKISYVANGLQIDGDPPVGADIVDGTFVGDPVGGEKHVYRAAVGAFDVTTLTTEIP